MKPLPKENFLNVMTCGDIHPNALDHFCAWVEEVSKVHPNFDLVNLGSVKFSVQ